MSMKSSMKVIKSVYGVLGKNLSSFSTYFLPKWHAGQRIEILS